MLFFSLHQLIDQIGNNIVDYEGIQSSVEERECERWDDERKRERGAVNLDGRATWDFDLNQKSEKLTIIINRQRFFSFSQVISNNF